MKKSKWTKLAEELTGIAMILIGCAAMATTFIYADGCLESKKYTAIITTLTVIFVALTFWLFRDGGKSD